MSDRIIFEGPTVFRLGRSDIQISTYRSDKSIERDLAGNADHRCDGLGRCYTHPGTAASSCLRSSPTVRALESTGVSIDNANLVN